MSRLGRSPIPLPDKVEVNIAGGQIHVKGPKGNLSIAAREGISVKTEDKNLFVQRDEKVEMPKATHGLFRALINNMIVGVTKGFEKRLSLIGVGYRAALQGQSLDLQLGFSHPTKVAVPKGVNVTVEKSVLIIITGIDKHAVGQFAATVRAMKPPEPYKGKGIRYENEFVRKKAGKAAKAKAG
ncbi:MAG: 50S ribosomal protein L6 [Verrucomicrobia bacterium]|nr:50S ribosomal protein L6 [Verrucomicrobiota bacterium]